MSPDKFSNLFNKFFKKLNVNHDHRSQSINISASTRFENKKIQNKINSALFYYVDFVVFGNSFKFRTDHVFLALCLVVAWTDWVTSHHAIVRDCDLWVIKVDTLERCEGKNRLTWCDESKRRGKRRKIVSFSFCGKFWDL